MCASTAFAAKTLPLPCVFPLPSRLRHCLCLVCSTAFAAKTLPFLAALQEAAETEGRRQAIATSNSYKDVGRHNPPVHCLSLCCFTAFPCCFTAFPCCSTAFPCCSTAFPCCSTAFSCVFKTNQSDTAQHSSGIHSQTRLRLVLVLAWRVKGLRGPAASGPTAAGPWPRAQLLCRKEPRDSVPRCAAANPTLFGRALADAYRMWTVLKEPWLAFH